MGGLVARHEPGRGTGEQFALRYVDVDGRDCSGRWPVAAALPLEFAAPVRSLPSFRGQHNNTGLWWCATTGRHVGYESWLQRDHVTLLDFDAAVVGLASQPFWLSWQDSGVRREHAPDFFARLSDGVGVVLDVRPAGRVRPRDAAAFAATQRACDLVGWRYRLVHEPEPVRMANIRWLAGFRHPRCCRDTVADAAAAVFAAPRRLMEGAALLGDPLYTLPTVFHLLWRGVLAADLSVVLSESSPVAAASG